MRKLLKFPNGKMIVSEGAYFYDNADDPVEEIDLSRLKDEEYKKVKSDPKYFNKLTKLSKTTNI